VAPNPAWGQTILETNTALGSCDVAFIWVAEVGMNRKILVGKKIYTGIKQFAKMKIL
jgi:hypothetical protein